MRRSAPRAPRKSLWSYGLARVTTAQILRWEELGEPAQGRIGPVTLVDMGFKEGAVPDEVPSFNGWVYENVKLQVIP